MKFKRPFLLVALTVCFVTNISAQAYKIKNGSAIQGGITQFDIL
ncbi:MAG: hypothetical protein ACI93P_000030 [bacterium]|jgi:hypothetical protein